MSAKNALYLDLNAGAPLAKNLESKILEWIQASGKTPGGRIVLGNPSSIGSAGQRSRRDLFAAEKAVRRSLGCENSGQWIWTSCGTEALQTFVRSSLKEGDHWWLGRADHSAVRDLVPELEKRNVQACWIDSTRDGLLDFSKLKSEIDRKPALVALLWANNETGVVISDSELRSLILEIRTKSPRTLILVDACQVWGKMKIDLSEWDFDALAVAGAKIGALPGTGGLWFKDASRFDSLLKGKQQGGFRAGTENVLGILSMGWAASAIQIEEFQTKTSVLQRTLENALQESIPGVIIAGKNALRVPNTTRALIPSDKIQPWVSLLDSAGYSVSAGSACASRLPTASHVLLAMGYSEHQAKNGIRISYGSDLTESDVLDFVRTLRGIWEQVHDEQ